MSTNGPPSVYSPAILSPDASLTVLRDYATPFTIESKLCSSWKTANLNYVVVKIFRDSCLFFLCRTDVAAGLQDTALKQEWTLLHSCIYHLHVVRRRKLFCEDIRSAKTYIYELVVQTKHWILSLKN